VPRHSPHALSSLTIKLVHKQFSSDPGRVNGRALQKICMQTRIIDHLFILTIFFATCRFSTCIQLSNIKIFGFCRKQNVLRIAKRLILPKNLPAELPLSPKGGICDKDHTDNNFRYSSKAMSVWQQAVFGCGAGQEPDTNQTQQHPNDRTHSQPLLTKTWWR
jgi:hypothetical protein